MDYFKEIESLGLGSRLRRMSDYLMIEARSVYKQNGVDFEPKCFPLFSLLNRTEKLTLTEASKILGVTHSFISQIVSMLERKGLLTVTVNSADGRSRYVQLTKKGKALACELSPIWEDIRKSTKEALEETSFSILQALEELEQAFKSKDLSVRIRESAMLRGSEQLQIVDYSVELSPYFENLNREWLEKYFVVEDIDLKYFKDPEGEILKKGGDILFAKLGSRVVGTCALIKDGDCFELAKMAVTESVQGQGIGRILMLEALDRVKRKSNVEKVILLTDNKLKAAIKLYKTLGFKEIRQDQKSKYLRGDMFMELDLKTNTESAPRSPS